MNKLIDNLYERTFASEQEITDELLDFYEKNPKELDLIIEEEGFHYGFLLVFFFLGLFLTIIARVMQVTLKDYLNEFMEVVVLDVASEIGIAIFGGTLVAYFIEYLGYKQFEKNKAFRKKITLKLKERKES